MPCVQCQKVDVQANFADGSVRSRDQVEAAAWPYSPKDRQCTNCKAMCIPISSPSPWTKPTWCLSVTDKACCCCSPA